MKKKLKIFGIVLISIILVGAGYLLYLFKFKEYDVADDEVDEIISEPYELELPVEDDDGLGDNVEESTDDPGSDDSSEDTSSSSGQAGSKGTASAGGNSTDSSTTPAGKSSSSAGDKTAGSTSSSTSANKGGSSGSSSGSGTTNSNSSNKPTVASIKNKYAPTFQSLESQANSKINSLVGRAKAEYDSKKANGESISYGYFYNKYMGAANALEAETDAAFNQAVAAVENDLARNGYNKSYAQSFVDEYNAAKKARRDNLLNKALGR